MIQEAAGFPDEGHFRGAATMEESAEQSAKARTTGACSGSGLASAKIESPKIEIDVCAAVIPARRGTRSRLKILAIKSVLVIHLSFFRIRQHVVCFLHLLEFLFRRFVPGIQVRVILPRQLAEGRANILRARLARDSQQFVIVLLCSCRHRLLRPPGASLLRSYRSFLR